MSARRFLADKDRDYWTLLTFVRSHVMTDRGTELNIVKEKQHESFKLTRNMVRSKPNVLRHDLISPAT